MIELLRASVKVTVSFSTGMFPHTVREMSSVHSCLHVHWILKDVLTEGPTFCMHCMHYACRCCPCHMCWHSIAPSCNAFFVVWNSWYIAHYLVRGLTARFYFVYTLIMVWYVHRCVHVVSIVFQFAGHVYKPGIPLFRHDLQRYLLEEVGCTVEGLKNIFHVYIVC